MYIILCVILYIHCLHMYTYIDVRSTAADPGRNISLSFDVLGVGSHNVCRYVDVHILYPVMTCTCHLKGIMFLIVFLFGSLETTISKFCRCRIGENTIPALKAPPSLLLVRAPLPPYCRWCCRETRIR